MTKFETGDGGISRPETNSKVPSKGGRGFGQHCTGFCVHARELMIHVMYCTVHIRVNPYP